MNDELLPLLEDLEAELGENLDAEEHDHIMKEEDSL